MQNLETCKSYYGQLDMDILVENFIFVFAYCTYLVKVPLIVS